MLHVVSELLEPLLVSTDCVPGIAVKGGCPDQLPAFLKLTSDRLGRH